jgi:hypothetical protein
VSDKRFQVRISLDVKEIKDGVPTDFCDNCLTYHDIGQDGVVAIESSLIEMLGQMNDWGVMRAMDAGLGGNLSALGMGGKVAALSSKA